jgi:hypothetical protein
MSTKPCLNHAAALRAAPRLVRALLSPAAPLLLASQRLYRCPPPSLSSSS